MISASVGAMERGLGNGMFFRELPLLGVDVLRA